MRAATRTNVLCIVAVFLGACSTDGTGGTHAVADAVGVVTETSHETTSMVAATEPHSCATAADGFGLADLAACSDASVATPLLFATFGFSEETCVRPGDVRFAVSSPQRSDAPDRLITIDVTRSDGCREPASSIVVAGRVDLSDASDAAATRMLVARRAVDQRLHGPPLLLLYDAQVDALVAREPPTFPGEATPTEG